jgi:anti-sigma B factor antagonist
MYTDRASISLRKIKDNVSAIDIGGGLTSSAEQQLMDSYVRAVDDGAQAILLNFDNLIYMNSSGIGLLVTMLIRANRQGCKLIAVGLKDHFKNIFELTRLNEAIPVYVLETEALEGLSD